MGELQICLQYDAYLAYKLHNSQHRPYKNKCSNLVVRKSTLHAATNWMNTTQWMDATSVASLCSQALFNPLIATLKPLSTDHHTAIQWLVHWPLMGGLLHLVQRARDWVGPQPAQAQLAVPNVTAHPSTASVPTSYYSMWNYNCLWSLKGWWKKQVLGPHSQNILRSS